LLDAGANDYLTKPFALGELKARLRALSRVSQGVVWPAIKLEAGDITLDKQTCTVERSGQLISLRRKEFELLECLLEKAGSVVTRQELENRVWPTQEIWTNTLDVHIKHLRDKLDLPFGTSSIQTVHGWGYMLANQVVSATGAKL
jgi:two-component system OmpR family response regulator